MTEAIMMRNFEHVMREKGKSFPREIHSFIFCYSLKVYVYELKKDRL